MRRPGPVIPGLGHPAADLAGAESDESELAVRRPSPVSAQAGTLGSLQRAV